MRNTITNILQQKQTVFTINQLAALLGESDTSRIVKRMYYYVHSGQLLSLQRGVYAKPGYDPEELACALYAPCYLSLEYVLQKAGVVFQYDSALTLVSYRNRTIEIDGHTISYRQMRGEQIANMSGIVNKGMVNIATPERAFLDVLYLNPQYHFDNLHPLNRVEINRLLPLYRNKRMEERVANMFKS